MKEPHNIGYFHCCVGIRASYSYSHVINPGIYAHPAGCEKIFLKTSFYLEPGFSTFLKISKTRLSNHQFFHENCWFFDVSEIPITHKSLILIFSHKTGTSGSLILKILKNQNHRLFKEIE